MIGFGEAFSPAVDCVLPGDAEDIGDSIGSIRFG
jgi:hypothetical protein